MTTTLFRLTQYAHGGGCACKIPPGELEAVVAGKNITAAAGRGRWGGYYLSGADTGFRGFGRTTAALSRVRSRSRRW